jgi:flagellar FliJ protein
MPARAQTQSLLVLMQQAEQQRDLALSALRGAEEQAERSRAQCAQLQQYRTEYQGRWSAQFNQGATMEIVACYRSFMQRLDQAVAQQSRQADLAANRQAQARGALLESERRVAAVRKLIERRNAEQALVQRQREQKQSDELAQRMRWRAMPSDATNTQ